MFLEDFYDVCAWIAYGIPEPDDWVDELKREKAWASWDQLG